MMSPRAGAGPAIRHRGRVLRRRLIAATLIVVTVGAVRMGAQPRVSVYITSVGATAGFTDPSKDNRDSVKDLRDDLKDAKNVVLTDSADGAAIVLTVVGRETAQMTAGLFGGTARDRILRVRFKAGDTETDLTASAQGGTLASGGAWSKAAGKIAKQVEQWVRDNAAALRTTERTR